MARIKIKQDRLVLRLTPVEKFMACTLSSPSVPVIAVRAIGATRRRQHILNRVMFRGGGNPSIGAATTGATFDGGRAAVFVYFHRAAVHVELSDEGGDSWRLFVASSRQPDQMGAGLRAGVVGDDGQRVSPWL